VSVDPAAQFVSGPYPTTAVVNILADIPEEDAILGWGLDLDLAGPPTVSFTALDVAIGPLFDAAFAPDGDGLAALVQPPALVWGNDILLATITLAVDTPLGTEFLTPGATLGDLTEGFITELGFAATAYTPGALYVPEPASLVLLALVGLLRRR
jgi:hypothetical protein